MVAPIQNNPVIGKSVQLAYVVTSGAGTVLDNSDASGWRDLVSGEFTGGQQWQVTLAPVEQVRLNPGSTYPVTGNPIVRMRFGGGGVSTEFIFSWPVLGTSFVIPAESLALAVRPSSAMVISAGNQIPTVTAWLMMDAVPTFGSALYTGAIKAVAGISGLVSPFAKRIHLGASAATTVDVVFYDALGVVIWQAATTAQNFSVPIPGNAIAYGASCAAGISVSAVQELSFT